MRRKKREPRGRTQDRDDRIMEEKETRTEEVKNSEVEKSEPGDVQNPEIKPGKTGWKKRPAVIAGAALALLAAVLFLLGIPQKLLGLGARESLGVVKEGSRQVIQKDEERKEVFAVYAEDISGSFNPAYAQGTGDQAVSSIVFEPLMERNEDGSWNPVLVKSMQISQDGCTYTLYLEEDVLFSDETPMTAQDAAASIAAMALTGNTGPMSGAYGRIEGMEEFISNPVKLPQGLEAADDHTLVIRFTEGSPDNLLLLGTQVQKGDFAESIEEGGMLEALRSRGRGGIGTGAYELGDARSGSQVSLTANPFYRKNIGDIKRVEFQAVSYYDLPKAVENGDLDLAVYSGTSPLFEILYDWEGFTVWAEPGNMVYALFYNQDNPILRNEKVRQAIACGYNREAVIQEQLVRQLMFEGSPGANAVQTAGGYSYQPSRAKSLMREAGEEMEILNTRVQLNLPVLKDNGVQALLANALRNDLSDLGIEVNIQELDQQGYMRALYLEMDFDLYLAGVPVTDNVSSYENFFQSQIGLPIDVNDSRLTEAYNALSGSIQAGEIQKNRRNMEAAMGEVQPSLILGRSKRFISLSADLENAGTSSLNTLLNHIYEIRVR